MIITNCPRCGAMNATTTCTKCGWSQFTKSTVSTGVLLDDYKQLLLENRNLKERVAELEGENKALRKQLWFSVCLKNVIRKETNAIRMSINKANNIASEERREMSKRAEMECKRCGDNEDRIDGFCSNECKDKYSLEAALSKMSIRIAELEGENKKAFDFVKTLRTYCIYAHWDNPDTEGEFNEFDAEICKWLSEFTEHEE